MPTSGDKEDVQKELECPSKIRDIINENIRIVRKSPSYTHDQITQISVKKVLEIMKSSLNDEELLENLQDLSLDFFTEPEKSTFWLLKEENLDSSCITGNALESYGAMGGTYLLNKNENNEK